MVDINKIAVVGVGLKGAGIAEIALMAGYKVVLYDANQELVDQGQVSVKDNLKKLESKGKLGEKKTITSILRQFITTTDLETAVKDADFIIENVKEDMTIKKQVFKQCGEMAPSRAILATNTSMMNITEIAKDSGRPEKCVGMHFFYPVPLMRLIEIISSENSSNETINISVELGNLLPCFRGKRFVAHVLKDRPGFLVNRLNAPSQMYLSWLIDQAATKGISWEQLDADVENLMPMGPCELSDYLGLDTIKVVMDYYSKTLSPDFDPGKIITELVESGNLGRITGKGFYDWSRGRPKIDKSIKSGLFNVENVFAMSLNEGCRILEEGIVKGYKIIDDANLAGMNAPGPFGSGKKNYKKYYSLLNKLADTTGKEYFRPCELMETGGFLARKK